MNLVDYCTSFDTLWHQRIHHVCYDLSYLWYLFENVLAVSILDLWSLTNNVLTVHFAKEHDIVITSLSIQLVLIFPAGLVQEFEMSVLMSSSSQIRCVSNLEIVIDIELCLLFFSCKITRAYFKSRGPRLCNSSYIIAHHAYKFDFSGLLHIFWHPF